MDMNSCDFRGMNGKEVAAKLNEMLKADRVAINALFSIRIPCLEELSECRASIYRHGGVYTCGLLGILNAMVAADGKFLFVEMDERFQKIKRFKFESCV